MQRSENGFYVFGRELHYFSCLPLRPGPAWVLLSYVLQTFFHSSVHKRLSVSSFWRQFHVPFTPHVVGCATLFIFYKGHCEIGHMVSLNFPQNFHRCVP